MVVFGIVAVFAETAFLLLRQRASTCTLEQLFGRVPSLCWAFVCFALVCLNNSLPFIQL